MGDPALPPDFSLIKLYPVIFFQISLSLSNLFLALPARLKNPPYFHGAPCYLQLGTITSS